MTGAKLFQNERIHRRKPYLVYLGNSSAVVGTGTQSHAMLLGNKTTSVKQRQGKQ
jgi:hypothetical protein